ncbi:PAK-related GC kinase Sid1 [Thecaphora frezii]
MMAVYEAQTTVLRDEIYDLLGIGYGPAHLSLSIALRESQEINEANFKSHFLEKREHFAWHPALLLPGSQLQVSPLKDLVTLRDPTSTYSFFNFLHSNGRLARYINKEQGVPSRREWTAYLAWAARRMEEAVSYGQEIVAVEPLTLVGQPDSAAEKLPIRITNEKEGDAISLFRIKQRSVGSDEITVRYARNVSVAVGGVPRIPEVFQQAYAAQAQSSQAGRVARIVHSGTYVPSMVPLEPVLHQIAAKRAERAGTAVRDDGRLCLAVLGGGQSSTEMMMNLHDRFPTAIVTMIFRASALVPSDDTGFINSVAFDPERTDDFWRANEKQRQAWLKEFKRTNYSVVRSDLLNELHDKMYDAFEVTLPEELQDPNEVKAGRMEMRRNTHVDDVLMADGDDEAAGIQLTLRDKLHNDRIEKVKFDAVFLGTGFTRSPSHLPFLEPLRAHYPALGPEWSLRDTSEEDVITAKVDEEDEEELERRRERVRGITRDYRLVPLSALRSGIVSGKSTPGASSDTSSTSSQQTLASELDVSAPVMPEPSLYVLGGNEATHGLSDSLLSICAHRAGELTASLLERLPASRRMTGPAPSSPSSASSTDAATVAATKTAKRSSINLDAAAAAIKGLCIEDGVNAAPAL